MNLITKRLILSVVLLISAMGSMVAQTSYEMNFQGLLAGIEGASIGEEPFTLKVQMHHPESREILYEFTSVMETDVDGWFGFTISNISEFMAEDNDTLMPVIIRLEFFPMDRTTFIKDGEDFLVTYTLAPSHNAGARFKMTRMEGSDLAVYSEDHLDVFKDLYPFAYLTGGFLLTDIPPVDPESVAGLREWITPSTLEGGEENSRGVKGAFPVGGYRKKITHIP
jgi:hypothetical protein